MAWRSPRSQNGPEPIGGEYIVHHERPYPHRLDRAFRIGAIVVAAVSFIAAASLMIATAPHIPSGAEGWSLVGAMGTIMAALAYGFTRAVGMIVAGIVGGLRRKAYVVDWQDDPPGR